MTWREIPIGRLYRRTEERGRDDLPLLSVYRDYGIVPREGRDDNFNRASDDLSNYKVVRPGDLVINKMKTWQGSLGVSDHLGIVSPAYFIGRRVADVDNRFMHHLLRSMPLIAEYGARSKGIRPSQWDLPWEEFASIHVRVPSIAEQRAIADYLDTETARVDALITKKRRMIELLVARGEREAERVAIAGEPGSRIPLSSVFRITKGTDAQRLTAEYCSANSGPFPVYSGQTSGAFGSIDTFDFSIPDGAIVVSTVGARVMSQVVARGKFSLSQNCLLMIPHYPRETVVEYFVPQMRRLFVDLRSSIPGHMQPSLRVEDLRGKWLWMSSLDVQTSVAERLRVIEADVARMADLLSRQADLLDEHRQALITAAVTGDVEIPGVAA